MSAGVRRVVTALLVMLVLWVPVIAAAAPASAHAVLVSTTPGDGDQVQHTFHVGTPLASSTPTSPQIRDEGSTTVGVLYGAARLFALSRWPCWWARRSSWLRGGPAQGGTQQCEC